MFVLYGIVAGLGIGWALGGSTSQLARVRLRWLPAIALAMSVQLLIFGPAADLMAPGDRVGLAAFLGSSALGLAAALANVRQPGVLLITIGATLNLAAILANGGVMPASAQALEALGWTGSHDAFSNSAHLAAPALPWLTDIFAMPPGIPFANVFSIGDVLIALGCGAFVALSMCRPGEPAQPASAAAR